jgi:hypothetical protein
MQPTFSKLLTPLIEEKQHAVVRPPILGEAWPPVMCSNMTRSWIHNE